MQRWNVLEDCHVYVRQDRFEPGETADVKDGDWQINPRQVCVWAKSETSEWNQFRTTPLNLVVEEQYQSDAPQVFNYTVR